MFLHQEYLSRNKIDSSWVGYPAKGTLIFRSNNPDRHKWVLMTFSQQGPDYHPQEYSITTTIPKRNCGGINGHSRQHKMKWDAFEGWIKQYVAKAHKLKIVKNPIERELTLWEIFVYCNDHWFSDWGFAYKKILFRTLNLELTLEDRSTFFSQMMNMMGNSYPKMLRQFESNMSCYKEDGWIGENDKRLLSSND